MAGLRINHDLAHKLSEAELDAVQKLCAFDAVEVDTEDGLSVNSSCKMCKLCIENGPEGLFEYVESPETTGINMDSKGIAVYVEHTLGKAHPVTFELIGKAKELAKPLGWPVYALLIGCEQDDLAKEISANYDVHVYICNHPNLERFLPEPYTAAFVTFIDIVKPSSVLVGATVVGRSLAPRVASRLRTGLTADCTALELKENGDLVQIRPAFGGNIMARIVTPMHRPQMATVRYKVFDAPVKLQAATPQVTYFDVESVTSRIAPLGIVLKDKTLDIANAEIIVACGRAFTSHKQLSLAKQLADLLGAEVACSRPLVEAGLVEPARQIGQSGRTVKPKLIITLGVSGAVQFTAGMKNAETIIAVNSDKDAPIFSVAHYAVVGDVFEILAQLIKQISEATTNNNNNTPEKEEQFCYRGEYV
ncbi:MAG: electron transfer flavoprotein subunit alpha/FixB family protein [Defluviitaleaceae bacterium]|nr:electron transfer flavoprotein subunit alpha/FixB family protein [Defluviitaleaceae bacterium]